MTGTRRAAILATVLASSAACEALVGITDREVALPTSPPDAGSGDGRGATESGTGGEDADATQTSPVDTGADGIAASPDATSADGGDGGDGGTSPEPDAKSEATTPPPSDAGDAGDTGPTADAGDAASIVDPDVPCAMQPSYLFCDDFDTVGTVGQGWAFNDVTPSDAGTMQLDTTWSVSSPASAQIVIAPVSGIVTQAQLGSAILGPVAGGVMLSLDLRVDVPSYSAFPQAAAAQLYLNRGASNQAEINFTVGPGATSQLQMFPPDGGASNNLNVSPPTLKTWVRVAIVFTTDGTLSLFEDGQGLGSMNIGAGTAGAVLFIVGAAYVNAFGSATVTFEIDNVVLRAL